MVLSFVLLFAAVFGKAAYADDVKYLPQKSNVDISKSWSIKFNSELISSSVNSNSIKVLDVSNNPQNISVVLQEDKKTVLVSPSTKYKYSTAYTLVITKDVRTQTGIALSETTKMQFTTMHDPNPDTSKQYTVCIDAGHGGDDTEGKIGPSGIREKDVDLSVALKLGNMLKASGVNIIYTRTTDTFVDYASRVDISNSAKADYYLSIHCNIAGSTTATGTDIIYQDGSGSAQSLAQSIQDSMYQYTGLAKRTLKSSSASPIPDVSGNNASVVKVCLGFINNPDEEKKLANGDFQDKCAQAISSAMMECKNASDGNSIISVKSPIKTINIGDSINLPTSIQVQYEDNSTKDVSVLWNTSSVNNSSAGTYTCTGSVEGYSKPVYATVIVLSSGKPTVCLDAGHGIGSDVGATGINKIQEDDITLAVTLKAGKILESNGVNVVYTRTSDMRNVAMSVDDSLQRRCDISNSANANYFVCIHCNVAVPEAHGTETYYYYNKENTAEWQLAEAVQNSLVSTLKSVDRGVKSAGWYVIVPDNINCPSILTELGFISNQDEGTKLSSSSYQELCAEAIAKAVLSRLGK
jgi:N-acetylmuramoyl-L-alanine amidase